MKSLVVFDLDGTLALSKSAIDPEMSTLLTALFAVVRVAIISGGAFPQFQTQVLARLPQHDHFDKLSLLPTCGTRFYRYTDDWRLLYAENLSDEQKQKITAALHAALDATGFRPKKTWGELIERAKSPTPHWAKKRHWTKRKNGIRTSRSGRRSRHCLAYRCRTFPLHWEERPRLMSRFPESTRRMG
jgi:hydroxymethylpyrimidine pyrophosphatase-like HAD family hydrolase